MDDDFNTTAGWVLFAGIVALGTTVMTGKYFFAGAHEKGGYEVADAAPGGEASGPPKPTNFAAGDPAKGKDLFSKCASCHSITQGGANGIGPNLWGTMGEEIGKGKAGYAFSAALSGHGGKWDWAALDAWLKSPKKFADGTKMSFAGLSSSEDRANLIRYVNEQGSNLPVPSAPAEEVAAAPAADGKSPPAADAKAIPAAGEKVDIPAK